MVIARLQGLVKVGSRGKHVGESLPSALKPSKESKTLIDFGHAGHLKSKEG